MDGQLDWGGVAVVAALYTAFLVVGFLAHRRVREGSAGAAADLMVAGRAMPLWIAIMTMTATWVDGGYLLGTAEYTYHYGLAFGLQGGVCFGISLILGGYLFARPMREAGFATMIDPFDRRFGRTWAAMLLLPALFAELFWSGALLVALGSTFSVLLHLDLTTAIVVSAAVVTAYTMFGGMWSVAYTDVVQLLFIPVGMVAAVVFALPHVGGLAAAWHAFTVDAPHNADLVAPLVPNEAWTGAGISGWWDMTVMLVFGGIPWNCYFQRVLSCEDPVAARRHSIWAGVATIVLTIPPALVGIAAYAHWGPGGVEPASMVLPRLLAELTPYGIMLLGLAAILGAVTSSFSASILSAGSMFAWNVGERLLFPNMAPRVLERVIRIAVVVLGALAAILALKVRSVAALWLFTGDLVFVLLFPQLLLALFDPRTNRLGSVAGFVVALAIRVSGGIAVATDTGAIGFPALVPYPELLGWTDPGWYDPASGATLFPVRTLAAVAGLATIAAVSRLTARWDPPRDYREGPRPEE